MTKIEWCDEVWNPIVGCTPISEGCDHCYAKRIATRFDYGGWDGMASFHADRIGKPTRWRKPLHIFVNSMGDLFHESVPFDWLENVWNVMRDCPRHIFMILTKRPHSMAQWLGGSPGSRTLPNVWLGVTAENHARWMERVPYLLRCPAAVRFVSVEPMLGPMPGRDLAGISWVICGAETGQGKRPMQISWYNNLRDQCAKAGVRFFGKKDSDGKPLPDRRWPQHSHGVA